MLGASFQARLEDLAKPAAVRKEQLMAFLPREEHTYTPQLAPMSRQLVQRFHIPGELVEDRLIRKGQVVAAKRQLQAAPSPTLSLAEGLAVANRLNLYHHAYRQHRQQLIQKYTERPTWHPTISPYSRQIRTRDHKKPYQSAPQLLFKPQINSKSRTLAKKLGSSYERLLAKKSTMQPQGQEYTFHPAILPRSQSVPTSPRWKHLYRMSMKTLEKRARLQLEARQRAESVSHCTFHPHLLHPRNSSQPVIDRLLSWDQLRQLKRKQAKECMRKAGFEDCTFKPTVLSRQIFTTDDWRLSMSKSSPQPRRIYRYSRPNTVQEKRREMESPLPSETSFQEVPSPTPPAQKDQHELTILLEKLGEELKSP